MDTQRGTEGMAAPRSRKENDSGESRAPVLQARGVLRKENDSGESRDKDILIELASSGRVHEDTGHRHRPTLPSLYIPRNNLVVPSEFLVSKR